MKKAAVLGTRAVLRTIDAGERSGCVGRGLGIGFKAADRRAVQVICNIYVGGRWDRVERFHGECYESAGSPHGKPTAPLVRRFVAKQ